MSAPPPSGRPAPTPRLQIVFHLADGSTHERVFKMGNQVEQLKGYLEQALGIPFGAQSIFLDASDGEFMIDPLSLSDYKSITPAKPTHIFVTVCRWLKW